MALTPLDIESRRFGREAFGYRRREVSAFLRACADALSQANLEKEELARAIHSTREELESFRGRERTLVEALAGAERLAEERKAMAQAEAEHIIADARRHAEQIISRTRAELTRIEQQILRLKVERETFEHRLTGLLDEHRRLLEVRREEIGVAERLQPRTTVPPPVSPPAPRSEPEG